MIYWVEIAVVFIFFLDVVQDTLNTFELLLAFRKTINGEFFRFEFFYVV